MTEQTDQAVGQALNGAPAASTEDPLAAEANATPPPEDPALVAARQRRARVGAAINRYGQAWLESHRYPNGAVPINPVDLGVNSELGALRFMVIVDELIARSVITQDALDARFMAALEDAATAFDALPRPEMPRVMPAAGPLPPKAS